MSNQLIIKSQQKSNKLSLEIKGITGCLAVIFLLTSFASKAQLQPLKISDNNRYFATQDGKPFFWLGDTGWLLFVKLKREEAIQYLEDRKKKGFNVIQVMLIHDINLGANAYGDSCIINKDVSKPKTTPSNNFNNAGEYDYWDNVDFVIDEAAKRGIYMALVPVWGGNIKHVNEQQAKMYATFLANRYKDKSNIIWLNGGDIKGSEGYTEWMAIGNTIRSIDKNHLIGYHPRGRNSSSEWFHNEPWLDFNMFQSGHRSYAQDTSANETTHYGEDNWRYVNADYELTPTKPTLDGEPSYEDIPYGLHNADEPYWQDYEIRRYAYWSVFAGGAGFTYGHNSVMQFYTPGDSGISFFPKVKWQPSLNAPGAIQMQYLKKLMLSEPYFDRAPAQEIIANNIQTRYNYILATKGNNYALAYTYTGINFKVDFSKLGFTVSKLCWFHPVDGKKQVIKKSALNGVVEFNPPGEPANGNDWVLILEK
ncbi:glycoside hydrolase family 140 protein [soil metagenome]